MEKWFVIRTCPIRPYPMRLDEPVVWFAFVTVPAVFVTLVLLSGIRLKPSTDKLMPAEKRRPVSLVSGSPLAADDDVPVLGGGFGGVCVGGVC